MNDNMNLDINNMNLEELEQLKKDLSDKTLKIDGNLDREKAFVETMSQQGREYRDSIQSNREERYEEIIRESETEEIPTIGSRK